MYFNLPSLFRRRTCLSQTLDVSNLFEESHVLHNSESMENI